MRSHTVKRIAGLVLLFLFLTAAKFKSGDRVVAQYQGGDYWYVGVVKSAKNGLYSIAYLDGSTEDALPSGHIKKFDWKVGTKVSCKYRQETWYDGTITKLKGDAVRIKYDDGDREDTTLALCRVPK